MMIMNPSSPADREDGSMFQLRFQSLFDAGRAHAFPCDARGHVAMDALVDLARNSYLCARAVIGREASMPMVRACTAS